MTSAEFLSGKNALIGASGFVGSHLLAQSKKKGISFPHQYRSSNIQTIKNTRFDLLLSCGTPAVRWIANQNPEQDWKSIQLLMESLEGVQAKKVVLLSTIDVLKSPLLIDETNIDLDQPSEAYGKHRFLLENFFRERFPNLLILRMPNLFGTGIKKNILFDLLNQNQIDKIHPDTTLQYYDLENIWSDMERAIHHQLSLLHLATEPISAAEIATRHFGITLDRSRFAKDQAKRNDFRTIYSDLWKCDRPGYLYSQKQIHQSIESFIKMYRFEKSHTVKPHAHSL